MNKKLIIGLTAAALLILGVGYYFWNNSNTESSSEIATNAGTEKPQFPSSLFTYPVIMTGSSTSTSDPESDGTFTIKLQDENTWEMDFTASEGSSGKLIYTEDASYVQNPEDGSWLKTPANDEGSPLDDVTISEEDLAEYQHNSVYQGMQSCASSECDAWLWTDPLNVNESALIKVDAGGRILEVVATTSDAVVNISYDYDSPVSIQVPEDATEFGFPQ